uniref:Disintegrin and metalloproteinase domain-containing protein 19-like n=1 Tax=Sparus aurata TaxID=8175 RepID=A0A671UT19_SPAAU
FKLGDAGEMKEGFGFKVTSIQRSHPGNLDYMHLKGCVFLITTMAATKNGPCCFRPSFLNLSKKTLYPFSSHNLNSLYFSPFCPSPSHRGLISLNSSDIYYLEPISSVDPLHHSLLRVEELPLKGGNCGHGHHTSQSNHISNLLTSFHSRVSLPHSIHFSVTFYRALNIRVPLIGLEVWTDRDQCIVNEEPNATLWSFLQWRQKLKSRKKHDNAQLLTGVIFKGTTIGMAPLEGMCSLENSGGINVDHSELSIGAAATMAHEIGHNFGMSHDHDGCCVEATAEQGGCVMAAATGHPFPRVFSRCSKRDLDSYFQKGGGMCLYNMPNMKDLVGGKKCGNGFVEDGEECDCGEPDECTNDCCNANNCTLKEEAQCAHGVCCEGCKLKQAGTMCRGPAGACDLPEYCTGASPYCPANVYLLDGSSCQYSLAYCYNGMCLTHEQQCLQLWGYGARPAHDACFEDVNAAGNAFGNCGKDEHGNYMKCEKSDAKCGKIQCHSAAKKPKGTNAVSIDTTIKTGGIEVKCRGTYVYSTQDGQGDLPDPGLVMTGTKCGEGKVCRDRRCQNASFTELETCIARCHGNGVCNSNGNCHCNRGWAPPFCEKPGLGGSVDSGPIQYDSEFSHMHNSVPCKCVKLSLPQIKKKHPILQVFSVFLFIFVHCFFTDTPEQQDHVLTSSVGDVPATRASSFLSSLPNSSALLRPSKSRFYSIK